MLSSPCQRDDSSPLSSPDSRQQKNASMKRALRCLIQTTNAVPQIKSGFEKVPFSSARKSSENKYNEESVKVVIRIRPLEESNNAVTRGFTASSDKNKVIESLATLKSRSHKTTGGETEYSFDHVFGEDISTDKIYCELAKDIVQSVTKLGINGTIFTYGQTNSGKTFTMQGNSRTGDFGIIQLASRDTFEAIKEENNDDKCCNNKSTISVKVSYVEVYNEELRDLLTDNERKVNTASLNIREEKGGIIVVEGLKEVVVSSHEHLMEVLRVAETNKTVGATRMNDRSSRSHVILKMTILKETVLKSLKNICDKENYQLTSANQTNANYVVMKSSSTLSLVDLAGSESVRLTGATGIQKKEGGMINQSLLTLSKVLMSLGQKNPGYVNYRESKLTRILKPSLSGNARMAVICCISPSDKFIEETRSTLQFASRAKLVKTNAVANEIIETDILSTLQLENARVKTTNQKLEIQIRELESTIAKKTNLEAQTRKQLRNLNSFVFRSTFICSCRRSTPYSQFLTDDATHTRIKCQPTSVRCHISASKDDSCPPTSNDNGLGLFQTALDFKAKQANKLNEALNGSMTTMNMYDLRFSHSTQKDIEHYKSKNQELESQLLNANSLISSLEHQVDDLSSQKNEALDWIEELIAKSDLNVEKLSQATKEKDAAFAKCHSFECEIVKLKHLLEFTIGEKEESMLKINSMKSEIDSLKNCLHKDEGSKEIISAHERHIHDLESERIHLVSNNQNLLKINTDEAVKLMQLQEALGVIKEERDKAIEMSSKESSTNDELKLQVSALSSEINKYETTLSDYEKEKTLLQAQNVEMKNKLYCIQLELKVKSEELHENKEMIEIENKALKGEIKALHDRIDELSASSLIVMNEKMQGINEKMYNVSKECDTLKCENVRLNKELCHTKLQIETKDDELRQGHRQLEMSQQKLSRAEKSMLNIDKERLKALHEINLAKNKSKECLQQLHKKQEELNSLKQAHMHLEVHENELHESLSRIQDLLDKLTFENASLKEINETLCQGKLCLENHVKELHNLNTSTMSERDAALFESKQLKDSVCKLKESKETIESQIEKLLIEKEASHVDREFMRHKYEKTVANFEALQAEMELLIKEKRKMENEVTFLEASKASLEGNADRILERDNAITGKYDRLLSQFKNQSLQLSRLKNEVSQLKKEAVQFRADNEKLKQDNNAMKEAIMFSCEKVKA